LRAVLAVLFLMQLCVLSLHTGSSLWSCRPESLSPLGSRLQREKWVKSL
jgi:hypothetical protein